jgi:acylphosphatase
MAVAAKHMIVHGDVQGVGFRYFVQRAATRLGVTGSVRNLPDETVEIFVEGEADCVEDLAAEVQQGPRLARVDRVDVDDVPVQGRYRSFLIEGW